MFNRLIGGNCKETGMFTPSNIGLWGREKSYRYIRQKRISQSPKGAKTMMGERGDGAIGFIRSHQRSKLHGHLQNEGSTSGTKSLKSATSVSQIRRCAMQRNSRFGTPSDSIVV